MPRTVLYIDDQPQLPAGFAEELRQEGYELRQTADPEQAIRWVDEGPPGLVLMEIDLAGCDGLDLLAGIRTRSAAAAELPVVILTRAQRLPGLYGEAVALGARDFLSKPVLCSELMASVRQFAQPDPIPPTQLDVEAESTASERGSRGGLGELALPEILRELHQHGSTGVLILSRGEVRLGVQLRNGSPVAVSTNQDLEPLGDFLLRNGWIDEEQHAQVGEELALGKEGPHEILVAMDAMSEEEMHLAMCRRAEEQLFQAFGWTEGRYRFFLGRQLRSESSLECDPGRLLFDGALMATTAERVAECMGGQRERYVVRDQKNPLEGLDLTPEQTQVLEDLDGERSLSEILDDGVLDERLLYALWISGRIDLCQTPLLTLTDALAEVAPEETGEGDAAPEAESGAARALEAERWFRKGEALLKARSYEQALEAFGMASHLDPNEGEYLSHLGYALYLSNPRRSVVQREAMEHIANGIKRSPGRETSYVFLGRILRMTGKVQTARKIFRRALKINPKCHAALQELRLLKLRAEKDAGGKGLLSRLRGR